MSKDKKKMANPAIKKSQSDYQVSKTTKSEPILPVKKAK